MYTLIIETLKQNYVPTKDQAEIIKKRILYLLKHKDFCYKNKMKDLYNEKLLSFIKYLNNLHSAEKQFKHIKSIRDLKYFLNQNIRLTQYKLFGFIPLLSIEEKITSPQKTMNSDSIDTFLYRDIRPHSILMVEFNNFHGECLPGIAKYFLDLGYNLDICLTESEIELEPFANFKNDKISLFQISKPSLKKIMQHDILERYAHVYINSDSVYIDEMISVFDYIGKDIKFPQGKVITMCHHAEKFENIKPQSDKFAVVALNKLPILNGQNYSMVNAHYFGDFIRLQKNKITNFICVGIIESQRKNHSLLFDAVEMLLNRNITNFKITVVARAGALKIPSHILPYLDFKGRLSYKEMYENLERADFYLPLFDPENTLHERYLHHGSSGSYQLIYGFGLPCVINCKFQTEVNGFNQSNSIGYSNNSDLGEAMAEAIAMPNEEYLQKVSEVYKLSRKIYTESLNNIKNILEPTKTEFPNNFFISLGENCFNRTVLSRYHLKQCREQGELSFPFDLCVCSIHSVYKLIENDFSDYFENLQWNEQDQLWINTKYYIRYNHDRDCSKNDKEKLVERYTKRIKNFRNLFTDDKEHMFIVSSVNQDINKDEVLNLYNLLIDKINHKFGFAYIHLGKEKPSFANVFEKKERVYEITPFYYKHIPHPYQNFWGEWYKMEWFNSVEGKQFENTFVNYIRNISKGYKMKTYYIVSGGFDPVHEGHIANILESASESDGVIALINSDEWLCRKKGKNFMNFHTRSTIIAAIKGVIETMSFDDNDNSACDGLRKVRAKYPDDRLVFAKGGDRTADNIPEISVCRELNIEIKYNVGAKISGSAKPNSSSWILQNWDNRKA